MVQSGGRAWALGKGSDLSWSCLGQDLLLTPQLVCPPLTLKDECKDHNPPSGSWEGSGPCAKESPTGTWVGVSLSLWQPLTLNHLPLPPSPQSLSPALLGRIAQGVRKVEPQGPDSRVKGERSDSCQKEGDWEHLGVRSPFQAGRWAGGLIGDLGRASEKRGRAMGLGQGWMGALLMAA